MPTTKRPLGAPIEYIAVGCHVWRKSHNGKINMLVATCGDPASAEALAIELAIIAYVKQRNRSAQS